MVMNENKNKFLCVFLLHCEETPATEVLAGAFPKPLE